jgi:hypothetical protein
MKQALMQLNRDDVYLGHRSKTRADAITALRQAIEQAEKQKFECPRCGHCCREWVGLTDEDIDLYAFDIGVTDNKAPAWLVTYARGIEAKLKEKNT